MRVIHYRLVISVLLLMSGFVAASAGIAQSVKPVDASVQNGNELRRAAEREGYAVAFQNTNFCALMAATDINWIEAIDEH